MSEQPIVILQKTRETLAAGWTQSPTGIADANDVPIPSDPKLVDLAQYQKPFRVCIVVAMSVARHRLNASDAEFSVAYKAVQEALHPYTKPFVVSDGRTLNLPMSPINFNETPGRTQEEVLALIDEAIAIAGR